MQRFKVKRLNGRSEIGSAVCLYMVTASCWPPLLEHHSWFLPFSHKYISASHCLSLSSVWTIASYLWTMSMWGRWRTAKLWRLSRRQVLSSASTCCVENRRLRKSPKSNSSKGLKVSGDGCRASKFFVVAPLKNPLFPTKPCPLDLANLLRVNSCLLWLLSASLVAPSSQD